MSENKTILIVDDDEDIRQYLQTILEKNSFSTLMASNGEEAMIKAESQKVDLILTDVKMPKLSGIELNEWCEENYQTFIILMTSYEEILETKEAHDIGLSHFITKPLIEFDLLRVVNSVINNEGFSEIEQEQLAKNYTPVLLSDLDKSINIPFPLFVKLSSVKYVKIAHESSHIDPDRIKKYQDKNINSFYMKRSDFKRYSELHHANAMSSKGKIDNESRQRLLLKSNQLLLKDIYHNEIVEESFDDAKKIFESTMQVITNKPSITTLLDYFNSLNDKFFAHMLGVGVYSLMLAKCLEWHSEQTLFYLSVGGTFHDLGKKGMNKDLIIKHEDDMTEEEYKIFRDHPINGNEILDKLNILPLEVTDIVIQHHENWDGSGYPLKLKKDQIYPLALVVHIIDLFVHQVVSDGVHPAVSPVEAVLTIEAKYKGQFDPTHLKALKNMISR
ncbi:hypothetical protein A9Q84_16950 [Halobacteriovorax marinus]|uniref:Response regulator n=1 Tax=Halobacteriovorax marinus TaxID=97084 RepID=A0A1Y5F8L0_9BACT|nr:hypothetical protein A9Q84_16950 [Halobacteriovorax marinus]